MPDTKDDTKRQHPADGRNDDAVVGVAAAAGRDQYVGAQVGLTEHAARMQMALHYDADLYRAVDVDLAATYANHVYSSPGRYNLPG